MVVPSGPSASSPMTRCNQPNSSASPPMASARSVTAITSPNSKWGRTCNFLENMFFLAKKCIQVKPSGLSFLHKGEKILHPTSIEHRSEPESYGNETENPQLPGFGETECHQVQRSDTKWNRVTPKWNWVIPSDRKWHQVTTSETEWNWVKPSDAKVTPSETKWCQVKPSDIMWNRVTSSEPKWHQRQR